MNAPTPFACGKADAVLALHLDGDLEATVDEGLGYAFVDGVSLHDHLRACAACQTVLRRARRLDAALANAAGAARSAHERRPGSSLRELEARWLAAVAATGATTGTPKVTPAVIPAVIPAVAASPAGTPAAPALLPLATPPAARANFASSRWLLPAAAVVAAATVMAWHTFALAAVSPSVQRSPRVASTSTTPPEAAQPGTEAPLLVAAPDALRHLGRQRASHAEPRAAGIDPAQRLADTPATLARRLMAPSATTAERQRAVAALLAGSRPSAPAPQFAHRALVDALAAFGDADAATLALHRELLASVRNARDTRSLLGLDLLRLDAPDARAERTDLAVITVAARLGDPELDQQLRRVGRRHRDTIDVVAAALRCGAREHGGGRLLLDLWRDREAIDGEGATNAALAAFRGQPAATFPEIADELRQSRVAPRRRQCLLALGCAADAATVPVLLGCARSPHHDEAHVAGWALAALPPACLDEVVAAAAAAPACILRAALARAGHPAAQAWVAALGLSADERALLRRGPLVQFPEVANWFRDLGSSAD